MSLANLTSKLGSKIVNKQSPARLIKEKHAQPLPVSRNKVDIIPQFPKAGTTANRQMYRSSDDKSRGIINSIFVDT